MTGSFGLCLNSEMTNFIIIFLCFVLGVLLKYLERFPRSTSLSINLFVIYVSLPALILTKFPHLLKTLELQGNWWVPISMSWLTFFLAWILIAIMGKRLGWSSPKMGALILTTGLGNTSFVGFPLLEAVVGKEAIPIGILADQPGSFLIVSSLGILVAATYSGGEAKFNYILKKVFSFPPFIALVAAIIWTAINLPFYDFFYEALEKISLSLVPLALFAVGFQTNFNWKVITKRKWPLLIGLSLKLLIFPLGFYLFYRHLIGINDFFLQVTILEAAMATQITSAVVASEFNLDTELANLMVGLSIPISLLSVPLINWYLFVR